MYEALKRLNEGFQYKNNEHLCGDGFSYLKACNSLDGTNQRRPEPFGPGSNSQSTREIPETADIQLHCDKVHCSNPSKSSHAPLVFGIIVIAIALSAIGILSLAQYRRRKQRLGSSFDISDGRLSVDQGKEIYRKNGSPLVSLEYSSGWDPLADGRYGGFFPKEDFQSFRFNLDEVESATQHFSEVNLLGKSNSSAIYKGILRDGSLVAIKSINKTSCKSDEAEFLKGLNIVTSLKHENLIRLRGICCSKGRGECFLVYDFIPNGNLLSYLDLKDGDSKVLEWSARVSIINGVAKG